MPTPRWQRLAEILQQQRGRIESNARAFADLTRLNYRIIYDIEHAKRDNYKASKLAEIENAYQMEPGSIRRYLDGGPEPEPITASHPRDVGPREDLGDGLTRQRTSDGRWRYELTRTWMGDPVSVSRMAPDGADIEEVREVMEQSWAGAVGR